VAGTNNLGIFDTKDVAGRISGMVSDPSGDFVAGATVTLNNVGNGTKQTTTTNDQGQYSFPVVPVGRYELEISSTGFQPYSGRSGICQGGLTGPQRSVMQALVKSDGRNLGELSTQVGLAHSTVSGIVDRLEKRGLVRRRPNPNDGRQTRIIVSKEVREFLENEYPIIAAGPLFGVLCRANESERNTMVTGIRVLRRLLDKQAVK
jgi:DNA-binding MarR family transcriptional regulator